MLLHKINGSNKFKLTDMKKKEWKNHFWLRLVFYTLYLRLILSLTVMLWAFWVFASKDTMISYTLNKYCKFCAYQIELSLMHKDII